MLIENGVNGLMTPVGDSTALSHAMDRLISQPEFAEALGSNGVEIRKRLDVKRIMEQWLLLFDKRGTLT
jgi:glycosyltransferase involved in cell wall biosynthesis